MEVFLYVAGGLVLVLGTIGGIITSGTTAPNLGVFITILGVLSGIFFIIMGEIIRQLKQISWMLKDVLESEENQLP